jgi:F-type H+-transporting ATPase subunit gamma
MPQEREIAARIASLGELAQIVAGIRAIAASQMQQAVRSLEAIRNYSELIREALSEAASLLPRQESGASTDGRAGLVLFGAEHGLCGAFNQELLRAAEDKFAEKADKRVLILVGTRGGPALPGARSSLRYRPSDGNSLWQRDRDRPSRRDRTIPYV